MYFDFLPLNQSATPMMGTTSQDLTWTISDQGMRTLVDSSNLYLGSTSSSLTYGITVIPLSTLFGSFLPMGSPLVSCTHLDPLDSRSPHVLGTSDSRWLSSFSTRNHCKPARSTMP